MTRTLFLLLLLVASFHAFAQEPAGMNVYVGGKLLIEGGPVSPFGTLNASYTPEDSTDAVTCRISKVDVYLGRGGKSIGSANAIGGSSVNLYPLASKAIPGDKITVIVNYKLYKNEQFFKAATLTRKVLVK